MMSDDSDTNTTRGRRKRKVIFSDDSSDSDAPPVAVPKKKRKRRMVQSDSESDSSIEIPKKKRVGRVVSDDESSGSDIIRRRQNVTSLESDSESDFESDWISEIEDDNPPQPNSPSKINNLTSSDDENTEKCPICLLSFKAQEVGSPESCDHSFCVECILEWSKNVNTCPVDRQTYNLILVRKHYNGKVIKQIPIEVPQPQNANVIEEDPTSCEICGRSDREDRMLLCDTCDQGYHLECLTPPLDEVPMGLWYCEECEPHSGERRDIDFYEVHLLLEDALAPAERRQQTYSRVIPRTLQTERVRARITTNRQQRAAARPSGSSRRSAPRASCRTAKKRRKKKKTNAERNATRRSKQTKTVKRRLAVQLGMCSNRQTTQMLPDVRIQSQPNNVLGFQRGQAGIPTLHLFGQNDNLEYFSDSEGETTAGVNLLVRRRPNLSDAAILRRAARRKSIAHPTITQTSTTNILDSILDIQSKFHSKNSVLSLNKDGSLKIDATNNNINTNNNNNNRDNLNNLRRNRLNVNTSYTEYVRQRPGGSGQSGGSSPQSANDSGETATRSETNTVNMVSTSSGDGLEQTGTSGASEEQSYTAEQHAVCSSLDPETPNKDEKKSRSNTPNTDSDLDIYSDIETVSTSRVEEFETSTSRAEEFEAKPTTPASEPANQSDDGNSDLDLVIDTEKQDDVKEQVSSSADVAEPPAEATIAEEPHSTSEIQNETVQSTISKTDDEKDRDYDEDSEDGCPNFSIYSRESINIAKTTKDELLSEPLEPKEPVTYSKDASSSKRDLGLGLYSDSEDEEIVKTNQPFGAQVDEQSEKPFELKDIINMTEDISEEERSYTPCLDERSQKQGLEGLDTEMISDEEDRNDFDESHEVKTASDGGEALEINAKESELDFSKPEDYEEGEIVDKSKTKLDEEKPDKKKPDKEKAEEKAPVEKADQSEKPEEESRVPAVPDNSNKENESHASFKKIAKKDRNYRDKTERSKSREKENKREQRRKEKRKEIERYNVRSLIAEKPRRMKDKFGRDETRRRSMSKSSGSPSPRRTRSLSRDRKKRKRVSRTPERRVSRSPERRVSRSPERRVSRTPDRRRSRSRKRRSPDRQKKRRKTPERKKAPRQRSRSRSRRRDFTRRWSRSRSRSFSPVEATARLTPSWTPPRVVEPQRVKPQNLTVILNNDLNKKKKEKKKGDKRGKGDKGKKRRREKTPPPSKEVFASGNNILVSVSFNKDTGERDVTKRKRDVLDGPAKKSRKDKDKKKTDERKRKKNKELAGVKPVAIIDLDRSPFRELTPSPEDVIILTDSDNNESNDLPDKNICDSSQQPQTPPQNPSYLTGPKTPPEPQVKFTLNPKQSQVRAINNPLHEPDEMEAELDVQEELEQRLNDTLHKGPNTPPEPPNSPPSSPDAYDPFDPTKSRSPTPVELTQAIQSTTQEKQDVIEIKETDDKSHTPPVVADIQPADSQTNIKVTTPEKTSPPEQLIGVIINQVVQSAAAALPVFSNSIITSTPNLPAPRVNILNSTIITPPTISAVPQRIVLPNTTKSSPVKVSPSKMPIKSTPIKPMPVKAQAKPRKSGGNQNSGDTADVALDFDSPYSPGSSDYEDLFEPPSETQSGKGAPQNRSSGQKNTTKSPVKGQSNFDVLFGSSPVNNSFKNKSKKSNSPNKYKKSGKGKGNTKQVGVKIDEDTLKILDDLPNSAVEMQVKDKFVDDWVLTVGPTVVCKKEKLQYLKKLNRQERVVEEVKLVLKPHYNKKHINKEEYKDILRRAVPKICHNKSGEINPQKIQNLIEAYVKKIRHNKKVTSSSSVNPQKV